MGRSIASGEYYVPSDSAEQVAFLPWLERLLDNSNFDYLAHRTWFNTGSGYVSWVETFIRSEIIMQNADKTKETPQRIKDIKEISIAIDAWKLAA